MGLPKPLKKVIVVVGVLAMIILAFAASAITFNSLATRDARLFCDTITVGEATSSLIDRAKRQHLIYVVDDARSEVVVIFHGFVFAHASCHAGTRNGVVVPKRYYPARD